MNYEGLEELRQDILELSMHSNAFYLELRELAGKYSLWSQDKKLAKVLTGQILQQALKDVENAFNKIIHLEQCFIDRKLSLTNRYIIKK